MADNISPTTRVLRFLDKPQCLITLYAAVLVASLVFIFRDFIFSDYMIASHDVVGFGVFYRTLLKEYLLSHYSVPGWNFFICCGLPFVDAIHGGIYYPLTFIDFCGDVFRTTAYNFMLHYFLAGVFMYLAARQFNLSRLGAVFAGLAYALSPCLFSWTAEGHDGKLYVATWFPLLMLFLDRLLRRYRLQDAVWFGLVLAVIILTPHLQMAYYVLWVVALFSVYKLGRLFLQSWTVKSLIRPAALLVFGVLLGLMISSVQLLPSARYLLNYSPRASVHAGFEFASQYSLRAEEAVSQLVPEFSGTDLANGQRLYWGKNTFKRTSESAGIVVLFMALLAFLTRGRSEKYFWGALASLVFLYALGPSTPFFALIIAVIPFLSSMAGPSTAMFVFVFCVAVLGGMGIENVRDRAVSPGALGSSRQWTLAFVLRAVPFILLLAAISFTISGEEMLRWYCRIFNLAALPMESAAAGKWSFALANLPHLKTGLWLALVYAGIAAVVVRIVLSAPRLRHLLWILPLVVTFANCRFNEQLLYVFDADRRFGPHPVIDVLRSQEEPGRTVSYGIWEGGFQLGYYGIRSTTFPHGKELIWFYELIGGYHRSNYLNPRLANLTATRYIICRQGHHLPPDILGPIPLDTLGVAAEYIVLGNRNCFPHAYLAGAYKVVPDRKAIHELVLKGSDNLRKLVLLEEEPELTISPCSPDSYRAEIIYYDMDSLEINVVSATNQLLVLSDTYFPAWRACVDGVRRPIHRAYGAFRAVAVPSGNHRVVMVYDSALNRWSGRLTIAGLLAAIVVVGYCRWRRRSDPIDSV
ncbi:MAG: hypothetical protein ABII79_04010 [bacterium]